MPPLYSFWFPTLRFCRTPWGAVQFPTSGLLKPSSAALPATVRLRRHTSTVAPLPLASDHAQHETKMMVSTAAEPLGQSGRRYLIERVLQEKGNPPRRVYLATSVLLALNWQHYLTC